MHLSKTNKATLALIVANIIWGAGAPIFKWSLENTPLFTLGFLRFIIPCILIFFPRKKSLKIRKKDFSWLGLAGFGLITCNILFFFLGLQLTRSINATMIGSSGPLFLILGSFLLLQEKITVKTILGNMLGFVGVFILVFQPLFMHHQESFVGNLFLIISTLGIVFGTIFAKKINKRYEPLTLTFWSLLIGAITFFPFFISDMSHMGLMSIMNIHALIGITFGAIFSSLLAYYLFFVSLKYFPASETGIYMYLDPMATFAIAIPLLHELPDIPFIIGSLLIFIGIYIAENRIHWHPMHLLLKKR